jgi:hypothetical protein
MLYPVKKKEVTRAFLAAITHPIALAWWYMDDGSKATGRNDATIATNGFTKEEVELLSGWMMDRWNIETRIHTVMHSSTGKQAPVMSLPKNAYLEFVELIKPYVPECMSYKIRVEMTECAYCGAKMPKAHRVCCSVPCAQEYRIIARQHYYQTHKKEHAEKSRQWKVAHRAQINAAAREAYKNLSPEKKKQLNEYSKAWRLKNRDLVNARKRARRNAIKDTPEYKARRAEECRRFRERLKQDPERLKLYREKQRVAAAKRMEDPEYVKSLREKQATYREEVRNDPEKLERRREWDRQRRSKIKSTETPEERTARLAKANEQQKAARARRMQDPEYVAEQKRKQRERYQNMSEEDYKKMLERAKEHKRKKRAEIRAKETPEERAERLAKNNERQNARRAERMKDPAYAEEQKRKARERYQRTKQKSESKKS